MAKEEAKKNKKKRKLSTTILWGLLGLVILVAGAASALYYMNRDRIQTDARLRVIKDFVAKVDETIEKGKSTLDATLEKGKSVADSAKEKLGTLTPGARTHIVKPGENLWAIARESDLVDNPWEWRTILLQNADKIEYAFISEEEGAWKVMLAEGQELTVSEGRTTPSLALDGKKFAFQLASMTEKQLKRAVYVVRVLLKDGYYAYLNQHEEDGQTWFRIRSGFYDSEAKAKALGQEIRGRYSKENFFPEDPWVVNPTLSELQGEDMVFGAQLVNPWVIELSDRDTHRQALRDLRKVTEMGEFAYIWQTRNSITRRFIYRVRIGFFGTEDQARELVPGKGGDIWKDAKAVKIENLEESLPGQHHRLGEVAF